MSTQTDQTATDSPSNSGGCSNVGTVEILGLVLPIMSSLAGATNGLSWYLVAHPNGPAIGCTDGFGFLAVLESDNGETIPADVRRLAVAKYRELTWSAAKKQFRGE